MDYAQLAILLGFYDVRDAPCPLCSPHRKPAHRRLKVLRIWRVDERMLTYCCAHCDAAGYAFADGDAKGCRPDPAAIARREAAVAHDLDIRIAKARTLYERSRPARALGAAYFGARGLGYPDAVREQLRIGDVWFEGYPEPLKALLMPFRDLATREVVGVHRIALDAFKEDGKRLKKSSGRVLGAAMMISRPEGGGALGICEGLETGVAVHDHEDLPVWCLSGASVLAGFGPVGGVGHLTVYADNDVNRTGQEAASACSRLWRAHADVEVMTPMRRGSDFADLWRKMP